MKAAASLRPVTMATALRHLGYLINRVNWKAELLQLEDLSLISKPVLSEETGEGRKTSPRVAATSSTTESWRGAYVCAASPAGPWSSVRGWATPWTTPSSTRRQTTAERPYLEKSTQGGKRLFQPALRQNCTNHVLKSSKRTIAHQVKVAEGERGGHQRRGTFMLEKTPQQPQKSIKENNISPIQKGPFAV